MQFRANLIFFEPKCLFRIAFRWRKTNILLKKVMIVQTNENFETFTTGCC